MDDSDSLRKAADKGDLETAKALLKDNPGLVSGKDDNGSTALH
jgi:hypothetical protein